MATLDTRTLSQFKGRMVGGGARPNLFEVEMGLSDAAKKLISYNNGDETFSDRDFRFLCKAASLPASTIANIDIPFRGRTFKVAGDRTVEAWTITVINDESFNAYRTFQNWMQQIGRYGDASGTVTPADYMGNAKVFQLGRSTSTTETSSAFADLVQGSGGQSPILAEYNFVDIWPSTVSNIDLSYDSSDTIEEFTVDFQVQYWYPVNQRERSARI